MVMMLKARVTNILTRFEVISYVSVLRKLRLLFVCFHFNYLTWRNRLKIITSNDDWFELSRKRDLRCLFRFNQWIGVERCPHIKWLWTCALESEKRLNPLLCYSLAMVFEVSDWNFLSLIFLISTMEMIHLPYRDILRIKWSRTCITLNQVPGPWIRLNQWEAGFDYIYSWV